MNYFRNNKKTFSAKRNIKINEFLTQTDTLVYVYFCIFIYCSQLGTWNVKRALFLHAHTLTYIHTQLLFKRSLIFDLYSMKWFYCFYLFLSFPFLRLLLFTSAPFLQKIQSKNIFPSGWLTIITFFQFSIFIHLKLKIKKKICYFTRK